MDRVLLHLAVSMPLENVAQESIVSLLEALEIVLEDLIVSFEHLDFTECQRCIMPVLNLVEVKDVPIN